MVPDRELEALLAGVYLFEGLPAPLLAQVARAAKVVDHADGARIMREGERGYALHVIVEGQAQATVGGIDRDVLGPGRYFGELSLIDDRPRSATVTALGPLRTITLTKPEFRGLLLEPEVAHRVMVGLAGRLREVEDELVHGA